MRQGRRNRQAGEHCAAKGGPQNTTALVRFHVSLHLLLLVDTLRPTVRVVRRNSDLARLDGHRMVMRPPSTGNYEIAQPP
jgi:hypothetical protein